MPRQENGLVVGVAARRCECQAHQEARPACLPPPQFPTPRDLYGLDDEGPVASALKSTEGPSSVDSVPSPRRSSTSPRRTKRRRGDGQPWGVPVRSVAIFGIYLGLLLVVVQQIIPGWKANPPEGIRPVAAGLMGLGFAATLISIGGAFLSRMLGNQRAFASESELLHWAWIGCMLLSVFIGFPIMWMIQRGGMPGRPQGVPEAILKQQAEEARRFQETQQHIDEIRNRRGRGPGPRFGPNDGFPGPGGP